jgi:hypothetical protein
MSNQWSVSLALGALAVDNKRLDMEIGSKFHQRPVISKMQKELPVFYRNIHEQAESEYKRPCVSCKLFRPTRKNPDVKSCHSRTMPGKYSPCNLLLFTENKG